MKVKRYNRVFSIGNSNLIDYDNLPKRKEFDESIADRRYFTPIRESVKSVPAGSISHQAYDFPDGKDDGRPIPISRRRGVDISEISQSILKDQSAIKGKIEDAKKFKELKQSLESIEPTKPTE